VLLEDLYLVAFLAIGDRKAIQIVIVLLIDRAMVQLLSVSSLGLLYFIKPAIDDITMDISFVTSRHHFVLLLVCQVFD